MSSSVRVFPMLGRAGLGNELFPLLRAFDIASDLDAEMLPPRWMQMRVGPLLRGERDSRQYFKIFSPPSAMKRLQALWIELFVAVSKRSPLLPNLVQDVQVVSGMDGFFSALRKPAAEYESYLRSLCRPSQLSPKIETPFVSFHIRLGDFARVSSGTTHLTANNTATPLSWYVEQAIKFQAQQPGVPILVSSDGTDEELAELISLPRVHRTEAKNALDEILILASSCGIVGSRSTFSAWGAFLGSVPMLVIQGGNAYSPHSKVWEDDGPGSFDNWLTSTQENVAARR